ARKRFCMAAVPVVTLPCGVSVVLISMSCLKIASASVRSAADACGTELCACADEREAAAIIPAVSDAETRSNRGRFLCMKALYGLSAHCNISFNAVDPAAQNALRSAAHRHRPAS